MVGIYRSVKDMVRKLYQQSGVVYYVSPSHFEHFVVAYKKIYLHMEETYTRMSNSLEKGLTGIRRTEDQIEAVQEELSKLSPKLVAKQHELEAILGVSGNRKEAIGMRMELLMLEEKVLDYHLQEGQRVQENCHAEFAAVIPILNKAVTGL
jgi:septal ring factor EnvC (AmiA/AmiB activator)